MSWSAVRRGVDVETAMRVTRLRAGGGQDAVELVVGEDDPGDAAVVAVLGGVRTLERLRRLLDEGERVRRRMRYRPKPVIKSVGPREIPPEWFAFVERNGATTAHPEYAHSVIA